MPHTSSSPFHCFRDDAMGESDATELAARIRSGEVSAEDVARAAVQRARLAQPVLNGVAAENYEQALKQAASLPDPDAPFAGVPTFIKDNTDVAGLPTGHGSAAVPANVARTTGAFARQMLAQGHLNLGKSTLPEFGFNATTEPAHAEPTRNPWNPAYSSVASSGGAAALVAAGVVPVAHANDGGGSIRIPAACCGLVGLKPTRGRVVDNDAARDLPVSIVSDGVVTRSVREPAGVVAQAVDYLRTGKLQETGPVHGADGRQLRTRELTESGNGQPSCSVARGTVESSVRLMVELGH